MGGFQIENLMAGSDGFGVSLGALLGRGNWSLTLSRDVSGSFSEVATEPTTLEMDRSFWMAMPFVGVEYKVVPFMGVKLAGGMGATLSFGDWEVATGTVAPDGPLRHTRFVPTCSHVERASLGEGRSSWFEPSGDPSNHSRTWSSSFALDGCRLGG